MDKAAIELVKKVINQRYANKEDIPDYEVFITDKSRLLQAYKYRLISTLPDDIHYEVIFNADKREWHLYSYHMVEYYVSFDN
jgi:hypothetical protein